MRRVLALVASTGGEGDNPVVAFTGFGTSHGLQATDLGRVGVLDLLNRQGFTGNAVFLVLAGYADDSVRHLEFLLQSRNKTERRTLLPLNIVIPTYVQKLN